MRTGQKDNRYSDIKNRIQILDCTLRDGGFANDFNFGRKNIAAIIKRLHDARVDIIELGFLESNKKQDDNSSIFPTFETLEYFLSTLCINESSRRFAVMITYPAFPAELLPERTALTKCDAIRVIIRYSELKDSLDFCKRVARKGYKVFIQPAITMRYSRSELQQLFDTANEIDAYALYIVDSYGYMHECDVIDRYNFFDANLKESVRIGFHAHNNLNLAFSNALKFLEYPASRKVIVDSSLLGMGQGSGNLQTEVFADFMNKNMNTAYDYDEILNGCEIIEKYYGSTLWGYSVVDVLAAINKTSYKYSRVLRSDYNMPFVEINRLLKNIPEDLRHRYTPENTEKLLRRCAEIT
jgi:4-hydroxy 2-oxovalerate aldolase